MCSNSWQYVATYIQLLCTIISRCGTVARAVGDISDPTFCMLVDQPAILQGIFSYFAGATRTESVFQLVAICSHLPAIAVHYHVKLWNRCTRYGGPIRSHIVYVRGPARNSPRYIFVLRGSHTYRKCVPTRGNMQPHTYHCCELSYQVVKPLHSLWRTYPIPHFVG